MNQKTIISSIPCDYIEKISDIGTKYALAIKIFKSSGADAVEYWLVDVPEDCTTVKLNKYSYQLATLVINLNLLRCINKQ
ncbi:MAG: hypothetical protein ACLR7D_16485 [Lachnospira eligens]